MDDHMDRLAPLQMMQPKNKKASTTDNSLAQVCTAGSVDVEQQLLFGLTNHNMTMHLFIDKFDLSVSFMTQPSPPGEEDKDSFLLPEGEYTLKSGFELKSDESKLDIRTRRLVELFNPSLHQPLAATYI